jgi:hypothetical protein
MTGESQKAAVQRRANRAGHGKLNKQNRIITALRLSAMLDEAAIAEKSAAEQPPDKTIKI